MITKFLEAKDEHITKGLVYLFVFIVALRALFAGVVINLGFIHWGIQDLDLSSTLPVLFSLLNLGHFRQVRSQNNNQSNGVN